MDIFLSESLMESMLWIVPLQVKDALKQGYEEDLDPPLGPLAQYIKDEVSNEGYKHMMAVGESVHLRPMQC